MSPQPEQPAPSVRGLKVIRYNKDGGYAPREWARAIEAAGIAAGSGEPVRVGVQITKARAVDVVVRVERVEGVVGRVKAALGRSESERLYRSRRARARIGMGRGLAVLSGTVGDDPVRVLVGEPNEPG
jgi:hypothetical protein